jgi:methylenetetrahydrofolate reductase (NADPH)
MDCNGEVVLEKARILRGYADAYNITDNQTGVVRLSSIAASVLVMREGLEPVMQMTCRDRNRLAIQSDILGAASLGIKNCLCISGDHQTFGNVGKLKGHPGAKNVYDIDSIQLLRILHDLRDGGTQQGGDPIDVKPALFIGAAWTPLGDPEFIRPMRLKKKVAAGADFIQTQGLFDVPRFIEQMKIIRNLGLHEQTAILAGIIVPKSLGMMRYMNDSVAGVTIPENLMKRMERARAAGKDDKKVTRQKQADEGINITVDLINQAREIPGIRGVHIQAIEWERKIPEIMEKAGLYPRPEV